MQREVTDPAKAAVCAEGTGSRNQCRLWTFAKEDWTTTLSISTAYMAGNLRPSFGVLYDWSGSYALTPQLDWTFWDPFRVSVRYNYIEGQATEGIGIQNRKDNIWVELQYLLY